jgi:hypothetical protein
MSLSQKRQLVGFLELICQELELTDTQFLDAKRKYEAVGNWLESGGTIRFYGPHIIPQGSISLGTTVRPIGRDDFDIDLVCKLIYAGPEESQAYVRSIVGDRLRENKTYGKMLEPLNRGWRLNYAKSNRFHLDITPAVVNGASSNGEIFVPDRELRKWKSSNPEGYISWFKEHEALRPRMLIKEYEMLRGEVQPLPEPQPFKSILKRAVQVLKRHRDIYFQNRNSKNAPISIIITTLAAKSYAAAVQSVYESELDLLYEVLAKMNDFILIKYVNGKPEYLIPNETTVGENFAEKWNKHPERAEAFFEWQMSAMRDIEQFGRQTGMDRIRRNLMNRLGEAETTRAFNRYTKSINESRANGTLRVDPSAGLGLTAGLYLRHNTIFGR